MEKNELKAFLQLISPDFILPQNEDRFLLALNALEFIGDTDPVFRDDLVLSFIETLILRKDLSVEEVRKLLDVCVKNIFFDIGHINDNVFKRTFSMLLIGDCLFRHKIEPYLSTEEITELFEQVTTAYLRDIDVRGFIDGKGWAHGAAHGADVLNVFAKLNEIDSTLAIEISKTIQSKVMIGTYGYIHNEDERMVSPIITLFNNQKLSEEVLSNWLKGFLITRRKGIDFIVQRTNIKNYLRSLYFKINSSQLLDQIKEIIENNASAK